MFTRKASKQLHSLLLEPNSQVIPLWVQRSTTYLKLPTLYCKQRATSTKVVTIAPLGARPRNFKEKRFANQAKFRSPVSKKVYGSAGYSCQSAAGRPRRPHSCGKCRLDNEPPLPAGSPRKALEFEFCLALAKQYISRGRAASNPYRNRKEVGIGGFARHLNCCATCVEGWTRAERRQHFLRGRI